MPPVPSGWAAAARSVSTLRAGHPARPSAICAGRPTRESLRDRAVRATFDDPPDESRSAPAACARARSHVLARRAASCWSGPTPSTPDVLDAAWALLDAAGGDWVRRPARGGDGRRRSCSRPASARVARRRADPSPRPDRRRSRSCTSLQLAHGRLPTAGLAEHHAPPSWRPISWRRSCTAAARRASSPRPGRARHACLTERARHLVTVWRLPPTALSLVAFNKRAQVRDAGAHRRPARAQRAHPELDRAGDRQRHGAVRPASSVAGARSTSREVRALLRALRADLAEAQRRSAGALDRRTQPDAARTARRPPRSRLGTEATSTA